MVLVWQQGHRVSEMRKQPAKGLGLCREWQVHDSKGDLLKMNTDTLHREE